MSEPTANDLVIALQKQRNSAADASCHHEASLMAAERRIKELEKVISDMADKKSVAAKGKKHVPI